jgi:hypothetical protein
MINMLPSKKNAENFLTKLVLTDKHSSLFCRFNDVRKKFCNTDHQLKAVHDINSLANFVEGLRVDVQGSKS